MKSITGLFLLLFSSQPLAFDLPPDFKASYLIEKYGSSVAETTLTLNQTDNRISYQSSSRAIGLAAVFTSDSITESSTLKLSENNLPPFLLEYQYSRKKKPGKNQTIKITWNENSTASIISHSHNGSTQLTASQPLWDKLSVQLALMHDISAAKKHDILNYKVIDKNTIIDYRFEYLDDENISIDNRNYLTRKLKRIHASGKRTTFMWLATELSNLPIAIEQYKNKTTHWRMELQDINIKAN